MKHRTISLGCLILMALLLVGCARSVALDSNEGIKPRTTLGEMTMRKAPNQDEMALTMWDYCDPLAGETEPGPFALECSTPQLPQLFIGNGIFAGSTEELDLYWPTMTWELEFDGHPVDLPAFGTIDVTWQEGPFRFWNVVVEAPTAGKHTVRYVIRDVENTEVLREVTYTITVQ